MPKSDPWREAYEAGQAAARAGRPDTDNPHQPSGHERDTTYADELHYQWWSGYNSDPDEPFDPE